MTASTLPQPVVGLVISFSYLWKSEHLEKLDEGRKVRPCLILFIRDRAVTVVPITHSFPTHDPSIAIEVPASVKKHLGLDNEPQWVIVNECNTFEWPCHDVRVDPQYGPMPPNLFNAI